MPSLAAGFLCPILDVWMDLRVCLLPAEDAFVIVTLPHGRAGRRHSGRVSDPPLQFSNILWNLIDFEIIKLGWLRCR